MTDAPGPSPEHVAQLIVQATARPPVLLDLLRSPEASSWNDDQLYAGVSHLLRNGIDVSDACKAPGVDDGPLLAEGPNQLMWPHEVAVLAYRSATRTLALVIKQRPVCAERLKDYTSLLAGVLSNKEYALLSLKARGANFMPHLEPLTVAAIHHGAARALPWLWQWQDLDPGLLQRQFQAGLPNPRDAPLADVLAVMQVLLAHGLNPNCTVQYAPPSAPGTTAPSERTLLEWAVLHCAHAPATDTTHDSPHGALVRLLLAAGAAPNARGGCALLAAATALRADLVTELVAGGADVAMPVHPGTGTDLLRWAVDPAACPVSSGVLQALLAGVKKAPEVAATTTAASAVAPKGKGKVGPGLSNAAAPPAIGQAGGAKVSGVGGLRLSCAAPATGATGGTSSSGTSTPRCAPAAAMPMVTVGGAAQRHQLPTDSPPAGGDGVAGTAPKPKGGGCRLPASLVMELRRDEALVEAVVKNDVQVVQCLLAAGADVRYKQDKALLLAMGAIDPERPDAWMPRPRDRAAVLSMSRPIVHLLLEHGADVNARQGRALRQARRWGDAYSVQYILGLPGADPKWMDEDA